MAVTYKDKGCLRELRDLTSSPDVIDLLGDEMAADACADVERIFDVLAGE
jgi:hypothetical protein